MVTRIFIDGEYGTTGLQIRERLAAQPNLEILSLSHADRHKTDLRYDCLDQTDVAILCLPDDAARETVTYLKNNKKLELLIARRHTVLQRIGFMVFPEMTKGQKKRIQEARYVANPGCYPTGAISLIRPLREACLIDSHYPISINAISGYTGGGKKLIEKMESAPSQDSLQDKYFLYALNLEHKHLPEIKIHGKIDQTPVFVPSVGHFPQGMIVNLPLHCRLFSKSANCSDLREIFNAHYSDSQNVISIASQEETDALSQLNPEYLAHKDGLKIFIFCDKNENIFNLCAVLDNLGKGASAAAIQNLNLMLASN
ncbi:N-acetyl-gamma-glutamyl-phosphate reductase [Bartonella ancashensis]|uniref:N-acetyl-gamma-glutamyl-phosphate reductase n=1 Tax=Bartonella ancashensis TaxID=1318743 RepID=A0A0M4LH31_9HYPH|nr:N-acetyl-gamma-glutamyl-phosphate reductase [Bartonella ancashensis]ALE03857.1 N-acetyl-gamma-glutamyl-phosphate reductase [Bartonella ancashensis]